MIPKPQEAPDLSRTRLSILAFERSVASHHTVTPLFCSSISSQSLLLTDISAKY
jgi:hypothetical protein